MIYETGSACTVLVGKGGGKKHLVRQGSRWINDVNSNRVCECRLDSAGLSYGPVVEYFSRGNGYLCSLSGGKLLEYLSHYWLLKEDCN